MPLSKSETKSESSSICSDIMINGCHVETISAFDRGIQYGDGLFETVACTLNVSGQFDLEFWPAHFQRLQQGAVRLGLNCPDENIVLDEIASLCSKRTDKVADKLSLVVKIILTRGIGERGYRYSDKQTTSRIIQLSDNRINRYFEKNENLASDTINFSDSASICVCETPVSINSSLAGIKHLNRLENVLARNEWQDQYTEGLMLDANQKLIEGTMSNFFGVKQGKLLTPNLRCSGVAGIIREKIIESSLDTSMPVCVQDLTLADLIEMDEIFICNSLLEILPVSEIHFGQVHKLVENKVWRSEKCQATQTINKSLQKIK